MIYGVVTESFELKSSVFHISIKNLYFYVIVYSIYDYENPESDPIIIYNENGIHKYMWRNHYYADYEYQSQFLEIVKKLKLSSYNNMKLHDVYERLEFLFEHYQSFRYRPLQVSQSGNISGNTIYPEKYYLAIIYQHLP